MHRMIRTLAVILTFALTASLLAGQVEIKLKDGSRWRGQVNDIVSLSIHSQGVAVPMDGKVVKVEKDYIVVDGTYAGQAMKKTIFKSDIVSMKTTAAATGEVVADGAAAPTEPTTTDPKVPVAGNNQMGVFVLPMKGMVGEGFRSEEVIKLAEHCDKYGPGQIIILEIESGGGLAIEMEKIHATIQEVRKRHRVIAWIKEAISAAAATASNCDEIYFYTTGTMGAMTMFNSGTGESVKGEELQKWLASAGRMFESGGRSPYIAYAMIDDEKMLSYDKDPDTGEVTWHNDMSGEFDLSDDKTNLVFTATTATESKFADGVADSHEELAHLLNLPKWHEKDEYGRKISKEWLDLVDKAKEELPLLAARLQYQKAASGDKAFIGNQIRIFQEVLRWWDRCPNVCFLMGVPDRETLERQLEELRRILARMN